MLEDCRLRMQFFDNGRRKPAVQAAPNRHASICPGTMAKGCPLIWAVLVRTAVGVEVVKASVTMMRRL